MKDPFWSEYLKRKLKEPYFAELREFIAEEVRAGKPVLPPPAATFNAFHACPWRKLRVVILGDKPYGHERHDHGIAFSSPATIGTVALQNIVKEVWSDTKQEIKSLHPKNKVCFNDINPANLFTHFDLRPWAEQGVLMLNVLLSCLENEPLAHRNKGWEQFIAETLTMISLEKEHVVFMLWGNVARHFKKYIERSDQHLILEAAHPRAETAKQWLGNRVFSTCNKQLQQWEPKSPVVCWLLSSEPERSSMIK